VRLDEEALDVLGKDPLVRGAELLTGVVIDSSVFPPLISTDGSAVGIATPCLRGYRPITGDFVHVLTDWNGTYSASRICLGRIAVAGGIQLERAANQSSTGGGSVTISWDTESADQGWGFAVTSTDVTVPTSAAGIYSITARAVGAGNFSSGSGLTIIVDSFSFPFMHGLARGSLAASITTRLNAADVIQCTVFNNGATQNFTARLDIAAVA
jgi:hypothetical protein